MANRCIKRLLLAIIVLAAIFADSCYSGSSYYAKIAKADWISYNSLYPDAIMEPEGYFLNEMAYYGRYRYGEDICNYYISQAEGRGNAIANCVKDNEQGSFFGEKNVKDAVKSTPFYDDINREIFVKGNFEFLGFYPVDGQLYYIYVSFAPEG